MVPREAVEGADRRSAGDGSTTDAGEVPEEVADGALAGDAEAQREVEEAWDAAPPTEGEAPSG